VRLLTILLLVSAIASAEDALVTAFSRAPLVRQGKYVLWHDPGEVEAVDFRYGIGGPELAPRPPFQFVDEDTSGTDPKVKVKDANGRSWVIKFGDEARPDTFCTRLAWATGYYVEPNYIVTDGVVEGARNLQRARKSVDANGRFQNGRFQLRTNEPKYLRTVDWSWDENPFLGTPELGGLKVLMMLVSNWDNKDVRDVARGSNTAIFEYPVDQQTLEARYLIIDWGAALGAWGNNVLKRGRWDAEAFAAQNPSFITGVADGRVQFGYQGQRTADLAGNITVDDVRWFDDRARAISDDHLRAMLGASGATANEAERFTASLRERLDQLHHVALATAA
jgi:hypothetical protein